MTIETKILKHMPALPNTYCTKPFPQTAIQTQIMSFAIFKALSTFCNAESH